MSCKANRSRSSSPPEGSNSSTTCCTIWPRFSGFSRANAVASNMDGPPTQQFIDDHPTGHIGPEVLADIDFLAHAGNQFDRSDINNDHPVDDGSNSGPALVDGSATATESNSINNNTKKQSHEAAKHDLSSQDMKSHRDIPAVTDQTLVLTIHRGSPVSGRAERTLGDPHARGSRRGGATEAVGLNPMAAGETRNDFLCVIHTGVDEINVPGTKNESEKIKAFNGSASCDPILDQQPAFKHNPAHHRGGDNEENVNNYHDAFLVGTYNPLRTFLVRAPDTSSPAEEISTFHNSLHRTILDLKCPLCGEQHAFGKMEEWAEHLDGHIKPRKS